MSTAFVSEIHQHAHPLIDAQELRRAFARFPSGVAAISAEIEGAKQVIVASSFSVGVSLDPPLALFSVQKTSSTWPELSRAKRLGVSVLSAGHEEVCRQLAGKNRNTRFDGVPTWVTDEGAVKIEGSGAWFDCSIFAIHEAGDHKVVIFEIHDLQIEEDSSPLVFHNSRFARLP